MVAPDPVAFSIFGFDVMWYGVLIGIGIILACSILYVRAPKYGFNNDKVLDVLIVSIPVGIIGARAYYVAFNWERYAGDIKKIINIRGGGLAVHGGLIAGILELDTLLGVGQKAALHQDGGTGDVVHQIDAVGDGLFHPAVPRLQAVFQVLLGQLGPGLAQGAVGVEDLGAVVLALGEKVLVDADEPGVRLLVDHPHPVVEVADLLLPQGGGAGVVEGDVLATQ